MRVPVWASAALILWSSAALADGFQTTVTPIKPGPSGWHFQFTPYAWTPWIDGDTVIKGREFSVSETPVQVLETLDFAFMAYMQARRGAITLYSDIIYADNSNSTSFATSKTFSPSVSGALGAALSADYRFWIVELGGMYETNRWKLGHGPGETDTTLDLLAGARYWHQELDVDVALAGTLNVDGLIVSGTRAIARSGGVDWVDPFIGARITYTHAPGEQFIVRGDIGGVGIGSKFTWQTVATYNWYLGSHAAIDFDGYLGWKALSVDYVQGRGTNRYEFDVIQQGPVVGLTGRF
ncbi:MAG: hypothetical protein K8F92_19465 [Hyphomicrobium sp.]|uniref:hypothetical protein n=1 Tax=Hyphomicrobium sp. TaxID=82 RepID=UPI001326465D|nr:hypothetical protein [Hyphomicrobium sp.]KAB2938262.1 MAG: hypothetical protein F9K20_18950 [Hyphomicrobium sp.]MBZ0211813.1 hypothetical protein [Hyphomicrobium sp.]